MGFIYDSSLQGHDFLPYRLRIGDKIQTTEPFEVTWGKPSPLLEIPLHWDTIDFAQFEFLGYYLEGKNPWFNPAPFHTPSQSKEIFTSSFDYCYECVSVYDRRSLNPRGLSHFGRARHTAFLDDNFVVDSVGD